MEELKDTSQKTFDGHEYRQVRGYILGGVFRIYCEDGSGCQYTAINLRNRKFLCNQHARMHDTALIEGRA